MRALTTRSLALLTIGSVDSIRNLPAAAIAGKDLPLYFFLALLLFLLPCAIICSWFSYRSSQGILGWVRQGLGIRLSVTAVWLQWMQNILIYPTFFAFIAGASLFCVNPLLANHAVWLFVIINGLVWSLTLINRKGIHLSNRVNTFCSSIGLILPFAILLLIGAYTMWHYPNFFSSIPKSKEDGFSSLTAIMLSFCGLEIAAVHSHGAVKHAMSKAITIAVIVIFMTMLLGSITIAAIIPVQSLNFVSDIPNLFQIFFDNIGYPNLAMVMTILVIIGSIGCANNWMIAPTKGLSMALDRPLNQLLIAQAILISLLSGLFLFFATIKASYWFMLTLATQMYLLLYCLMYLSAIKVSLQSKSMSILLVAMIGIIGVAIALVVSMRPPTSIGVKFHTAYMFALLSIIPILILPVLFLWRKSEQEHGCIMVS